MSADPLWPDGVADRWLDALRLPALEWAQPLVPCLGLPAAIKAEPQVLRAEAAADDLSALRERVADLEPFLGLDGAITREVVIRAMHRLGELVGADEAAAFERWARLHVVSHAATVALFTWRMVLLGMLRSVPDPADPLPPALAASHDVLERSLSEERAQQLENLVAQHAPSPSEEELGLGLDEGADAVMLKEIAWNQLTLEALAAIGDRLTGEQRDEVVDWVARQAREQSDATAPGSAELARYLDPDSLLADLQPAVTLPIPELPEPGEA